MLSLLRLTTKLWGRNVQPVKVHFNLQAETDARVDPPSGLSENLEPCATRSGRTISPDYSSRSSSAASGSLLQLVMEEPAAVQGRAVVLGSGIAGLAAAQVLSKHFARVLVLERDAPRPSWQQNAADVVKYNQVHAVLAKGLYTLDDIFDGRYTDALRKAGGNIADMFTQFVQFHPSSGLQPWSRLPATTPVPTALASRHLLEMTARKLVQQNDRVTFMYGAAVTGLICEPLAGSETAGSADGEGCSKTVKGVLLSDGCSVSCELLVDCSGRGSPLPNCLAAAGYQRPRVSRATANCGYSGWYLQLDPDVESMLTAADCQAVSVLPDPPHVGTFGVLMRIEHGQWIASIGGFEGVHPPKDDTKLLEWCEQHMWHPALSQVLKGSSPLAPAARICGLASTWRRYDELPSLPERLVVLGDALCSFNPSYGQGMTVAAMEAAALDKLLTQRAAQHPVRLFTTAATNGVVQKDSITWQNSERWLQGIGKEALKAVHPIVKGAWLLAVGGDLRFPSAVSNEPKKGALVSKAESAAVGYMHMLLKMAPTDSWAKEVVMRVLNLLDPPYTLLHPLLLYKVARFAAKRQLNGSSGVQQLDVVTADDDSIQTNLQRWFSIAS